MKHVDRSVVVAAQHKAATWTSMNTNRQIFRYCLAASATLLGGAFWVHSDKRATSFFRFVCELPNELAPASIQDALRKPAADHVRDVQVFDGNQLMLAHDFLTNRRWRYR